jgi:alginate O-acetyltransferase complex protein AlgI
LYIPLGGSRGTKYRTVRNTFIIFLICGFWHGANWTFIAWGFLNALYFIPRLLLGKSRKNKDTVAHGSILPNLKESFQMAAVFALTGLGWIFFRADSVTQAFSYIRHICSTSLFSVPKDLGVTLVFPLILILLVVEWLQKEKQHGLEDLRMHFIARWSIYYSLTAFILYFAGSQQRFIYFQF